MTDSISRRGFLKGLAISVVAAPLARAIGAKSPGAGKPNFIIIFTDDQGYGGVACFGSKNIRTPRLYKMAC